MAVPMTPVRSSSSSGASNAPTVPAVGRSFIDALTRVRGAAQRPATAAATSPSAAAATTGAATTNTGTASTGATTARAALGAGASSTTPEPSSTSTRTPIAPRPATGGTNDVPRDETGAIISRGTLSTDPHTEGMYVPPDFYHGNSYSPVFDRQDENGNWRPTPRFEGQKIYSKWRASLPPDWDPNARVIHDPLLEKQGPRWWKQDENGDWVKRPEGPEGVALLDDGTPVNSLDPAKYPDKS